jgi:hypothetical protein
MAFIVEMSQTSPGFPYEPAFEQRRELVTDLIWSHGAEPRVRRLSPDCHLPFIIFKQDIRKESRNGS